MGEITKAICDDRRRFCFRTEVYKMNIGWDLDDTLVKTTAKKSTITIDDDPFINPLVAEYIDEIDLIITGRHYSIGMETTELLKELGVFPKKLYMNNEHNYSQDHIAGMKSKHLRTEKCDFYVEDNPNYRAVMRKYTDIPIISVDRAAAILKVL